MHYKKKKIIVFVFLTLTKEMLQKTLGLFRGVRPLVAESVVRVC